MADDDRSYYQSRAEAELGRAQQAGHPGAAKAHYDLAGFYFDRVHNAKDDRDSTHAEY